MTRLNVTSSIFGGERPPRSMRLAPCKRRNAKYDFLEVPGREPGSSTRASPTEDRRTRLPSVSQIRLGNGDRTAARRLDVRSRGDVQPVRWTVASDTGHAHRTPCEPESAVDCTRPVTTGAPHIRPDVANPEVRPIQVAVERLAGCFRFVVQTVSTPDISNRAPPPGPSDACTVQP